MHVMIKQRYNPDVLYLLWIVRGVASMEAARACFRRCGRRQCSARANVSWRHGLRRVHVVRVLL